MASTGLWAEKINVSYLYPVYNTEGVPASGIKEWKTANAEADVLTADGRRTLGYSFYVVTGNVTLTRSLICDGAVHLILADNARLIVTGDDYNAGIQVSGEGNSLTIYGQTEQSGQLEATGQKNAAGIGGLEGGAGSNITINGGNVTAKGGAYAAGIGGGCNTEGYNITINGGTVTANGGSQAAAIGGGFGAFGSNITINGGTVTANGGIHASGIGGGERSSGSNIFIATDFAIKADGNNPPETVITNTGSDLANDLDGKQYVKMEKDLTPFKTAAIAEINAAIKDVTDEDVIAIAEKAKTDIDNATSESSIYSIKTQALKDIAFAITKVNAIAAILSAGQGIKNTELNNWIDGAIKDIKNGSPEASPSIEEIKEQILYFINLFQNGKAEGKTEALGPLGTKQNGPAVEVIKGDKKVILYSPDKVNYIKVKEN